ncbi:MAG: nuclear transport factor 2 family protein [Acidobacteria bacterium]|nr:nuclear transport factor 2 family protein [Acidobacteriota bacterium]
MKKIVMLMALTCVAAFAVWLLPARAESAEEAGVRAAIDNYFRGHATGDGEYFKRAFHPDAKLFWIRDGKLTTRTSAEYIAGASGKAPADEAQRKRRIESIDITGNAALVKVTLDYPAVRFTDYMSMLKIDGEWKIVNKTFYAEQKARQ